MAKPKAKRDNSQLFNAAGQLCFHDLHRPVQPWGVAVKNALLSFPLLLKKLTLEGVIWKACRQTGLQDFGDEDRMPFREPFAVFMQDANDAHTTPLGMITIERTAVDLLANRLKIVQAVKEHPEILDEQLEDPVFMAGFPRTGTTHLHRALSKCSDFRILKYYEVKHPVEGEKNLGPDDDDPRWGETSHSWNRTPRFVHSAAIATLSVVYYLVGLFLVHWT